MHIWTGLVVLCSIVLKSSFAAEECGVAADIVFVLDSSTSIWGPDLDKAKTFVQAIIKGFPVGGDKTHIAAVTFSTMVHTAFNFKDSKDSDADAVAKKIAEIVFDRGDKTQTHQAIAKVTEEVFISANGAREDVPHICVIVTDGASSDRKLTLKAANKAKDSGIKIIAIGIGNGVVEEELNSMVSAPASENAIFKDSYTELENATFQQFVAQKACAVTKTTTTTTTEKPTTTTTTTTTTESTCTKTTKNKKIATRTAKVTTTTPMIKDEPDKEDLKQECQGKEVDVLFVLDMSSSIWTVDFDTQLKFVADVVGSFDVQSGKTRVGLIAFSDEPKIGFDFKAHNNKEDVEAAVMKITKDNGITNTHLALNTTIDMFTPAHGSRPGVAHICILITDGISSKPKLTKPAARKVHDKGIYVFTIGVGNMTDKEELEMMSSKPADKYTFEVNGYDALPVIKELLAYKACKVPADESRCLEDTDAKIVFGLVGIGGQERPEVFDFIRRLVGGFSLEKGKVSVGLYEVCSNAEIDRRTFESNDEFKGELDSVMEYGISDLIVQIRLKFPKRASHSKSRHVTILVVSGGINDMAAAQKEAMRLKYKSNVIVVNVGPLMMDGFKKIATDKKSHLFSVSVPSEFPYVSKRILNLLCKEQ